MTTPDVRSTVRSIAKESLAAGDATGWFEKVYTAADGTMAHIPWADGAAHPRLLEWLASHPGDGKRALVVGCGLGDDAESLAKAGYAVIAFDIAPTAIAWCRQRFPLSSVEYVVADLLQLPGRFKNAFDFVFEAYTLQSLPSAVRVAAQKEIAGCLAPQGRLLVVARGRDEHEPEGEIPWPLTRAEFQQFLAHGLSEVRFEEYVDSESPPVRRFTAIYTTAT